jgi:tetratricopeptide (TPR) repeat protein
LATAALSIKLRCGSWQQLSTIYKRDLSRGSMFLKASTQPPLGTVVRIDLELPSATVIELQGVIAKHVVDPTRGAGVDLKLEPLPTNAVWLIESALAAETKVRAETNQLVPEAEPPPPAAREDVSEAESELLRALESEAESLRKLNPFLVLGVGYETTDTDVRAAFGELTKRYHPDRFARYQSTQLRQLAAEIFILIRDAYRKLADEASRTQLLATLKSAKRAATPPPVSPAQALSRAKTPPPVPRISVPAAPTAKSPPTEVLGHDTPTKPGPYEAPTSQSPKSAELAHTELAKADLAIPVSPRRTTPAGGVEPPVAEPANETEELIDQGRLDEALARFRNASKKSPSDKAARAGIELVEGLKALEARDRMEAAQRFEAALELDPSNERAARELAEMRRQATNERKGLLSRLMGKKEPST